MGKEAAADTVVSVAASEKFAGDRVHPARESFAIDNTNPTKTDRQRYIPPAQNAGYRIVGHFIESKIKDCIERNNKRVGMERIPANAIAATSNKSQPPSYNERLTSCTL